MFSSMPPEMRLLLYIVFVALDIYLLIQLAERIGLGSKFWSIALFSVAILIWLFNFI